MALGAGATANLACFRCLAHHDCILEKAGVSRVSTYPPCARFKFGDGRLGEVRHFADSPVSFVGEKGKFTASVLKADIPAFLLKGASEALLGQSDCSRDILTLRQQRVHIPPKVNGLGHTGVREGPTLSASCLARASTNKRPGSPTGGLRLPCLVDGLCRCEPPRTSPASRAVTLDLHGSIADAMAARLSDPEKIIMNLHANGVMRRP